MSAALSMIEFGCPRSCSGLIEKSWNKQPKFGIHIRHSKRFKANCQLSSECATGWHKYSYLKVQRGQETTRSRAAGADGRYFPVDDDTKLEPFLISLGKHFLRDIKWALLFLWEQPGQLRFIEWPSFQSTLKTAILTVLL
ncbi:hypothetical protein KI387_008626, partial [Taxus chinensis]